jgi:UDP-N-acetylglucosamine/UDP-N-acetylgalactosamine diphosphorylase
VSFAHTAANGSGDLRERFAAEGQGHVFRFWASLDSGGRERLARQAAALDLAGLRQALAAARRLADAGPDGLEPPVVERLPERGGDAAARIRAVACGEALLSDGAVAVLVLAGGQGTRLGHEGPKGTFPLGPVSRRSLFALQAEKLRGVARRHGRPLRWYVLTSRATDAPTRAFFAREGWFGLGQENVVFLVQRELPVLDLEGRLLLETPDRIATAPDGHGGCVFALGASGALRDLAARGVRVLTSYQVDNPLVRIADPALLGFHALAGADMTSKAVAKQAPDERVGTVARRASRACVVEYTEIREPWRSARGADGDLLFWAGAIGVHAFAVDFLAGLAERADALLPVHASAKRVATVDDAGGALRPAQPNAIKLERFVFDALPRARTSAVVEARREEEYSPLKNASGGESVATARRDLSRCARHWLEAAGIEVPDETLVEVDHSRVDGVEEARALQIRRAQDAPEAIRIGSGVVP